MFDKYLDSVGMTEPIKYEGKIVRVQGVLIESSGPQAMVGELCHVFIDKMGIEVAAEVVSLKDDKVQLMVYGEKTGIEVGCKVRATGHLLNVKVGPSLLGRVVNALGDPIDGKGPLRVEEKRPISASPPDPMTRPMITKQIETGIRAIDSMVSVGKGQRMGIFAGSGVGKSTILNLIEPKIMQKTAEVSQKYSRGKHTTCYSILVDISEGGKIIDTPGVRELLLYDIEELELQEYFPEFEEFFGTCNFSSCTHIHEPGCSVLEALKQGKIHIDRYESYIRIMDELKNDK